LDLNTIAPDFIYDDIHDIDFAPGNSAFAVVGPYDGMLNEFLFSSNADEPDPVWESIVSLPAITPGIGEYITMTINTCFISELQFYCIIRYKTRVMATQAVVDDVSYLCEFNIIDNAPILTSTFPINTDPSNEWVDLHFLQSDPTKFVVGMNQDRVFVGTVPTVTGSSISLGHVSYSPSCAKGPLNTHGDIRVMRTRYNAALDLDELYIGTDGGISFCPDINDLNPGSINDAVWQNLNGPGLSIGDFESIETSEIEPYKILAIAGDGNSWLFSERPDDTEPTPLGSVCDAYKAAISIQDPELSIISYNGKGWGFDNPPFKSPITYNIYDNTSGEQLESSRPVVPRGDVVSGDYRNYMMPIMPFEFLEFNNTEQFYAGTNEVFRNADAFQDSPDQGDWEQLTGIFQLNTPQANPLITTQSIVSRMKTFQDPDNSNWKHIYVSTYKNRDDGHAETEDDMIKLVHCIYKEGELEPYEVENITPGHAGGGLPTPNQVDLAFITGMAVDFNEENYNNTEIWVSFGSNTLNEWGYGTHAYEALWYIMDETDASRNGVVYYSPDNGSTWYDKSDGLPNYPVIDLEYWEGSDDIVFAATGNGIYAWNKTLQTWECFSTNLPNASSGDIEINYCTSALRTCLYGYGIWETPLPDLQTEASTFYNPTIITSDATWQLTRDAYADIIIKPGATLTISNCEIRMPKNGKIIVENGGALIVDGATITNHCDFWQGIEVWGLGNDTPHPVFGDVYSGAYPVSASDHGVVYLKNGATLENALLAICTYNSDDPENGVQYGGIVVAYDANFLSNYQCVELKPFDYGAPNATDDNISAFKNCTFLRDENVTSDLLAVPKDIILISVDGISIHGCYFYNMYLPNKPTCIESVNSSFTLNSELCITEPTGCTVDISTIEGYFRGVSASNTSYYPLETRIEGIEFINNERAIYLSVNFNAKIWRNTFRVPDLNYDTGYGLYLEGCNGYHVEGNYFTRYATITDDNFYCSGIIVENNHNIATEIYRNSFEDIEIGIRSQGNNSKLQIKCNEFIAPIPKHNIIVTSGTIGNQGICNATTTAPAGNTFSSGGSGTNHFRIVPTVVGPIFYRHHTELGYIPQYYSTSKITLHNCSVSGDGYCVSTLPDGTGGEERIAEEGIVNYDSLINLELARMDGGSTEALLLDLQEENVTTLLDLLNSYSPYISDTILKGLSVDNVFSDYVLLDVLELNQPISDSVTEVLQLYNPGLPDPVVAELNNNMYNDTIIPSAAQEVEANVNVLEVMRDKDFEDNLLDKITENEISEALTMLDRFTDARSYQRKVELFAATGDYTAAQNLCDSLQGDPEQEEFIALYNIITGLGESGSVFYAVDSVEISTLLNIQTKESTIGICAQNLLQVVDSSYTYPEIIDPIPDEELRLSTLYRQEGLDVNIYPVPADAVIFVEFDILFEEYASFEIIDLQGTIHKQLALAPELYNTIYWLDVSALAPGMYLLNMSQGNGAILASGKFIVQR